MCGPTLVLRLEWSQLRMVVDAACLNDVMIDVVMVWSDVRAVEMSLAGGGCFNTHVGVKDGGMDWSNCGSTIGVAPEEC